MLHFFHLLMKWNLALQCLQIFYCSFWCWLLYAAQTCKNSHYYNDVKIKWNTGEIQWHCDALRWNGIQGQAKWNTGTIYVGDSRNTGEIAAFKGEVGLASPTIFLRKLFNNKVKKTFFGLDFNRINFQFNKARAHFGEIMKKTKNHITMIKSKWLWLLPCRIIWICICICLKSVTVYQRFLSGNAFDCSCLAESFAWKLLSGLHSHISLAMDSHISLVKHSHISLVSHISLAALHRMSHRIWLAGT